MLIQFSVENYRSIRDQVVLSMLAGSDTEHVSHLIQTGGKDRCLKSCVIYGANASGKSTVLNALWFMINYVLTSHEKQFNLSTNRVPFKFDPDTPNQPSAFEVIFMTEDIKYVYGFSVDDEKIIDEYLYHYPNGRKAVIFERSNTSDYRFTSDIELQEGLKERNSDNKLYLSTAANWNYKKVLPVFRWFSSCRFLNMSAPGAYGANGEKLKDEAYRKNIAKLLQVADLGIQALSIKDENVSFWGAFSGILDKIETTHQVRDAQGNAVYYQLSMAEESSGTYNYFRLIGEGDQAIKNGSLLIADEMDAFLHALLIRHVIQLFNNAESNINGAQMLFTSHNTSLLNLDLFRRDQIWFTEKDENTGKTDLYSLYDFPVRKDAKVEKGYLNGKYGAIPFIQGGSF